ncbi:tRNA wybutosine-synthesizing protein 3 homolog [Erpetoichthys calabaricus]|uniref:tRNA wybutosine-synthesizing protein 3 homolog n=1 Tax=Erpetoichthys calabaricus TaxID=27687 RepID=A0A8C4S3H9_ERPCA|nr:tRNA wybutosine-synthesizing protein 3 homolog [Erpetoichthys calabaricus]
MDSFNSFKQWKKQCLSKIDLSKKGTIDEIIVHLVSYLNESENFFSTSSCSGRIILIDGASGSTEVQKQGCAWLFVTHQKCAKEDLISSLQKSQGDAVFKFEPFVLHVQCHRLEDAQLLHSVAINSGFRNSGITVGKKGKIIMAVRSTHCLEVPLTREGELLATEEYIDFLVEVANQKMEENKKRIDRFFSCLQHALTTDENTTNDRAEENGSVYTRRRRKGQNKTKCVITTGEDDMQSDEDDLLETGLTFF